MDKVLTKYCKSDDKKGGRVLKDPPGSQAYEIYGGFNRVKGRSQSFLDHEIRKRCNQGLFSDPNRFAETKIE